MNYQQIHRCALSLIVAGLLAVPGVAISQEESESSKLEEITVIATRRESSIQDISVAVSAFTDEYRDKIQLHGAQDIADFTPGLVAMDEPDDRLSIRGVGRTTNKPGSDPGVGVYLDGVYTTGTGVVNGSTLTVERIEVLRGPQGTLYGRNTAGGAINVISKRPTDEWTQHARGVFGNFDYTHFGASIAGPLSDNFRIRFDASKEDRGGFLENLGPGNDLATVDNLEISAQMEWDITDRLDLWVRAAYQEYDQAPHFRVLRNQWRNDVFHEGLVIHPWWGYDETNPAIEDPWTIRQDEEQWLRNETKTVQTHLTYDAENFVVKYIAGYNDWDFDMHYDGDGVSRTEPVNIVDAAGNPWTVPVAGTVDQLEPKEFYSHELQLLSNGDSALDWVVGLYYYKEDQENSWDWRTPGNEWLMNAYLDGSQVNWWETGTVSLPNPEARGWFEGGTLESESYAIFGQVGYELNDRWKLTAGLRYSDDKKESTEFQQWWWMPQNWWEGVNGPLYSLWDPVNNVATASSITSGLQTDAHEASWDGYTGMMSAEFRPNLDTLLYLTVSQGHKAGGFLVGALADRTDTPENEAELAPEEVISAEFGYKADLTDSLRVNAAAYYYDYTDMQTQVLVKRGSLSFLQSYNVAEAEAYGIELETLWRIGDNTRLNVAASFSGTEMTDFCGDTAEAGDNGSVGCLVHWQFPGEAYDPSGNDIVQAPETTWAANLSHDIPIRSGNINLNATHAYTGPMEYAIIETTGSRAPGYHRTDFNLSFTNSDNRYTVYLFVKNAFDDDRPTVTGLDQPQYGPHDWAYYSYPRIYGAGVHINW